MSIMFIVIGIAMYRVIQWNSVSSALLSSGEANRLLNPFATEGEFGLKYVLLVIMIRVYGVGAWSPSMQKFSSAASPKDARLIMFLNCGRVFSRAGLFYCGLATFAVLILPQFTHFGLAADAAGLAPGIQTQMTAPIFLSKVMPVGVMGLMFAGVVAAFISTNDSYMLTWTGVIVQDVICPLRKKPLGRKQHIWLLRIVVILVGAFLYIFGLTYESHEAIIIF